MSSTNEGRDSSWDVDDRARKWPGIAALALFGVLAWVFVNANFGNPAGFPEGASVLDSIGYAMFNIQAPDAIPSEGFLVAFIVIAVVLDAALDGAVMLASREEEGTLTTALRSDAAEREPEQVPATDGGSPVDSSEVTDTREVDD
jgi:NADH-quinone oxidoreductase subunit J